MASNTRMVGVDDDFSLIVWEFLQETQSSVDTALTETLKIAAKDTAKNVKKLSPRRPGLPARYASGWVASTRTKGEWIVYNKTHYRLTHLLENGHVTVYKTGRYGPRRTTTPNPHIAIAEKQMKETIGTTLRRELGITLKKIK